jgi:hypothetical protein
MQQVEPLKDQQRLQVVALTLVALQSQVDRDLAESSLHPIMLRRGSKADKSQEEETDNRISNIPMLLGMLLEVAEVATCKTQEGHQSGILEGGNKEATNSTCRQLHLNSSINNRKWELHPRASQLTPLLKECTSLLRSIFSLLGILAATIPPEEVLATITIETNQLHRHHTTRQ